MSDIKDFPAFPRQWDKDGHNGMTLRDYFAASALSGFFSAEKPTQDEMTGHKTTADFFAYAAYVYADSMLRAREAK
jgi:hypothetical protein